MLFSPDLMFHNRLRNLPMEQLLTPVHDNDLESQMAAPEHETDLIF